MLPIAASQLQIKKGKTFLALLQVVYVHRRVAGLFNIVCSNTECSPNPSIICQGWG